MKRDEIHFKSIGDYLVNRGWHQETANLHTSFPYSCWKHPDFGQCGTMLALQNQLEQDFSDGWEFRGITLGRVA
jgi:hypothetical protein